MKITKIIDQSGEALRIPIDDNDQTVGLTIAGVFEGILQIVGIVSLDGRETELTVYNPDGTVGSLEDEPPLDFFLDVGGYTQVQVIAVALTSGKITVTASTSSAKRIKMNAESEDPGQNVNVTNLPDVQPVSGPLTNSQFRSGIASVLEPKLNDISTKLLDFDIDGNPLPDKFDSYESKYTYLNDVEMTEIQTINSRQITRVYKVNLLQTEYKIINGITYTTTYIYDPQYNLSAVTAWVKS